MHLFTLLITAAFSTQFTAINEETDDFTLTPNTVLYKDRAKDFTVKIEQGTKTWTSGTDVHYVVSKDDTLSGTPTIAAPDFTSTKDPTSSGVVDATFLAADMAVLTAALTKFEYYVYAGETNVAGAVANGYATVTILPDFTPDRKAIRKAKVTAQADCPITLNEAGSVTWTAAVVVVVTKNAAGTGGVKYELTGQTPGKAEFIITEANWGTLAITTETDVYIFAGATEVAARASPGYKVPIIEDDFTLTPTELAVTATTVKDLVITPTPDITVEGTNQVKILLSKTEVFDLTTGTWEIVPVNAGTSTYKLATRAIGSLAPLAVDEVIHVYVQYQKLVGGVDTTVYMQHSQEILVKPLLSVTPASIASSVLTIAPLVVTTTAVDWPATIQVIVSKTATSPPTVTADIIHTATPTGSNKAYTVDTLTLPTDQAWIYTPKVYVHIGLGTSPDWTYATPPVEITVTPDFTLTASRLKASDTTIKALLAESASTLSHGASTDVTLWFTTDATADRATIVAGNSAALARGTAADIQKYSLASWTVPGTLTLTAGQPLYVHASYMFTGDVKKWLSPMRTITVNGPDQLEFAVSPKTLASDVTSLTGLKITPITHEEWTANQIKFKITDVAPGSGAQSNNETTGTATKDQDLNEWVSDADVDIATLTRTVGANLYVYASMANNNEYLPIPDTIAIEAPTPPAGDFTIDPTTVELKDLAAFKSIKITESATEKVWTAIWVVISKTTGHPTPGANDVVKENQAVTAGVCTITLDATDFTTLGTIDETTTLHVHAAPLSADAALAATPATIEIEKTLTFTIAPKEMEWKETLTTPEITITPTYPGMLPQTEVDTFVAKFTKTVPGGVDKVVSKKIAISGEDTKIFKIPATDLAELAIAKPTTAEILKVSLHSAQGELGEEQEFKVNKPGGGGEAAMGVSPLLSLLAAALLLIVKLF